MLFLNTKYKKSILDLIDGNISWWSEDRLGIEFSILFKMTKESGEESAPIPQTKCVKDALRTKNDKPTKPLARINLFLDSFFSSLSKPVFLLDPDKPKPTFFGLQLKKFKFTTFQMHVD